jgi:predicted RNase H-like nuclease (RuvC/YqgF family)
MERMTEELLATIEQLKEENKNLKEKIERLEFDVDAWHQLKLLLE